MNRLIIIGNGFDLAHGIKTSYHDFILDYLKSSCLEAIKGGYLQFTSPTFFQSYYFSDELIEIKLRTRYDENQFSSIINNISSLIDFNEFVNRYRIEVKYHFKMLKTGVEKLNEYNWVDFEIEYFKALLEIKNKLIDNKKQESIIELNNKFEVFKTKLEAYLIIRQEEFENNFDKEKLCDCFCEDILEQDVDIISIVNQPPKRLLFLNFNYTNTILPYIEDCVLRITSDINFIHGALNYDLGKPIFGFGDETDKRYSVFENEGNNELFKHIKTFEYLKTNNYSNLTRFLAIEEFQVHIYGHSCGLSDRTMLKEIFEHSNCMSIKIFYHEKEGSNDYTEKTHEIYRHFTDKNMMRNKVVNEKYCRAMPQPILM